MKKDEDIAKMLAEVSEAVEREDEEEAKGTKQFTYVRAKPEHPYQVYSVRIPIDRLAELQLLAGRRGRQPSALVREFVLDRLDAESEAPILTVRLVPHILEQVSISADSLGLTPDEFVAQAVALLVGRCSPS